MSSGCRQSRYLLGLVLLCYFMNSHCCLLGKTSRESIEKGPYKLGKLLHRAEELFRDNNYSAALIFYYEAKDANTSAKVSSKLHFRIGECLEAVRRFDFATYHYRLAIKGQLPDVLQSRAIMKLEHLPELAQKEEAERLYNAALRFYKKRNLRKAIDNYLSSLRLMPALMAKDDMGLINDAINYLTYLSESKDKEPARLLKLATLLELKGEVEKSKETLKQIIIIYPDSDEAVQSEEKLDNYGVQNTSYVEPVVLGHEAQENPEVEVLISKEFDFTGASSVSRKLNTSAFTFRAHNERVGIPENRFEEFSAIFGNQEEQKEFTFNAQDKLDDGPYVFETASERYEMSILSVQQTRGYIQDLYGNGKEAVSLFSEIKVHLKITRK